MPSCSYGQNEVLDGTIECIPKSEKRTKSLDDWGFMKNELKEKAKRRSNFEKKVGRSVSFYNKSREFSSKKFE